MNLTYLPKSYRGYRDRFPGGRLQRVPFDRKFSLLFAQEQLHSLYVVRPLARVNLLLFAVPILYIEQPGIESQGVQVKPTIDC